ncbi:MAG: diheme cytochrome c [Rhodospirillum sp.]|nr:diheme cytochrome c [Rhodospirillum sp.]MCF8491556.1 diheme cytochrome c [Rhodospirillum sp.]MCF8501945.1 diheme cytochrome c [Rhodospirillum sp.]
MLGALSATLAGAPLVAQGEERIMPVTDPLTLKECGECHMAFPPSLLSASSWRSVMANLDDHYGDNASLPEKETAAITAYLVANTGRWGSPGVSGSSAGQPLPRFTESQRFAHEHRRFTPDRLAREGIKSIVDCVACHRGAEQGYYDDD